MSTLMKKVYWSLGQKFYSTYEAFISAVTAYNEKISPGSSEWDPNREIAQGKITVFYEASWKDEDDTVELEVGDLAMPLTMGQVLFEINNGTIDFFANANKHFFEGLTPVGGGEYELEVGS